MRRSWTPFYDKTCILSIEFHTANTIVAFSHPAIVLCRRDPKLINDDRTLRDTSQLNNIVGRQTIQRVNLIEDTFDSISCLLLHCVKN